jgi:hypothetical protein
MLNNKSLVFLFFAVFLMSIPTTAFASNQCVKNNSATVLNVTWHNQNGQVDENASNHSLSVGLEACQNNPNLGFAVIECSGCIFARLAAQTAIAMGGMGAFGVCIIATDGYCSVAEGLFETATRAAIEAVPPAFEGKKILVVNTGKTVSVIGNAFKIDIADTSNGNASSEDTANTYTECSTGMRADNMGQCSIVVPGYYSTDGVNANLCPPGSQCYAGGTNLPFPCQVGTYSKAGASSCTDCPRNTMQDQTGQAGCGGCSTGYGGSDYHGNYVAGKYVASGAARCLYQCNQNENTRNICYN